MAATMTFVWSLNLMFTITAVHSFVDHQSEELFLKRLSTGHLYTVSQFSIISDVFTNGKGSHYKLFPKSFGQIIKKYNVAELHLSLTHGRWRQNLWGHPIVSAPYGVELWVWFSPGIEKKMIDTQWSGLVNALSGQFCASLNFLQKSVTASPLYTFRPMGLWPKDRLNASDYLRYAVLPREVVCTENLTPWKKLLPCESKAGISTLFNALHLYEASFHSLAVHLRSICKDVVCSSPAVELKQILSTVYDPAIADLREGWSFGKVFGEVLKSSCPLAKSSKILVALPDENDDYHMSLSPAPRSQESRFIDGRHFQYAVYDLKMIDLQPGFNLQGFYATKSNTASKMQSLVHVHRYATGYGEESGGIVSLIANRHPNKALKVVYFDMIPWYIPVYFHTLKIMNNKEVIKPDILKFLPAKDRIRPTTIEMVFIVPPKSTLKLTYSFMRSFLRLSEHPPDSHHGYYIGSAVVSMILPDAENLTGISEHCSTFLGNCTGRNTRFVRIHSESNLVVLPTPDFSMPFHVICLTCTIFAIGLGSFLNLATRDFVVVSSSKKSIKQRLKHLFGKFFKSKAE